MHVVPKHTRTTEATSGSECGEAWRATDPSEMPPTSTCDCISRPDVITETTCLPTLYLAFTTSVFHTGTRYDGLLCLDNPCRGRPVYFQSSTASSLVLTREHESTNATPTLPHKMSSPAPAAGLLGRQFKAMQKEPIPGISCGLVESNVFEWEVMLMISDDCKYYGGTSQPLHTALLHHF